MNESVPNQVQHDGDNNELPQDEAGEAVTGPLLAITSSLSSDVGDSGTGKCDLVGSVTGDEDRDTSPEPEKVVTRREMIVALIARSEVEEEPEQDPLPQSGEAYNEVTHHQQAGTSVALEMRHLEGDSQDKSANGVVEEYKGYYRKFATSIDDLPWKQSKVRCNLCSKIISKKTFNDHIRFAHLNKNRVKCDVCGKEVKKYNLNQHKLIHSNQGRAKKTVAASMGCPGYPWISL